MWDEVQEADAKAKVAANSEQKFTDEKRGLLNAYVIWSLIYSVYGRSSSLCHPALYSELY